MGNRKERPKVQHNRRASDKAQTKVGQPGFAGQLGTPPNMNGASGMAGSGPARVRVDRDVDLNRVMGSGFIAEDKTAKANQGQIPQEQIDQLLTSGPVPGTALDRAVRRVLFGTLKDGTLLDGLTAAIEQHQARERLDQSFERGAILKTPMPPAEHDDRRRARERAAVSAAIGAGPGSAPPMPQQLRVQDFFDRLDSELDRFNDLITVLEQRLSFLIYHGPSDATDRPGGATTSSPPPTNELEARVDARASRAAAIRARLEALHESLRI